MTVVTPTGQPVHILTTKVKENKNEKLLKVKFIEVKKTHPEYESLYESVAKKVEVDMNKVRVNLHQDAILDLVQKLTKFANEVSANAKNLLNSPSVEEPPDEASKGQNISAQGQSQGQSQEVGIYNKRQRRLSRRISIRTTANIGRWAFRAKRSVSLRDDDKEIDLKVEVKLAGVECDFMTSRFHLAFAQIRDCQASFVQTKSKKVIEAKLIDFQIHDPGDEVTNYKKIAESLDEKVFEAKVTLYEVTPEMKMNHLDAIDVRVEAEMGRVKVVFLMKFVNDLLNFLDPFTSMTSEKANLAFEGAAKSMIDAYANKTRAQLDIKMFAPLIIIPVNSTSNSTFIADLGTLHLVNHFVNEGELVFDQMHFILESLQLFRSVLNHNMHYIFLNSLIKNISFNII